MRRETQAREELVRANRQLEEYRTTLPNLPPDLQALTQELKQRNSEVEQLRLQEKQREQAESSLYTEIDRLSAAWETLDKELKSKVFDLSAMEERLSKLSVEVGYVISLHRDQSANVSCHTHQKAKSENKFYSAMREKEGIENERKNLARNGEKQSKLIEKVVEEKTNLSQQIVSGGFCDLIDFRMLN